MLGFSLHTFYIVTIFTLRELSHIKLVVYTLLVI